MQRLVIAHEDRPAPPWVLPDGSGWDQRLVLDAAGELGIAVDWRPLPWPECLPAAERGAVDAVLAVSYRMNRAAILAFPLHPDGRPDVSASLHTDSYAIYRHADHALGPEERVAAQRGFAVVEQLQDLGIAVDEHDDDAEALLARLASGAVTAAALLTVVADHLIARHADWQRTLTRDARVLCARPYFLAFAVPFHAAHGDLCARLWQAIRDRRGGRERTTARRRRRALTP